MQVLCRRLRLECRDSPDIGVGRSTGERYRELLAEHQRRLWGEFDWPQLRVDRDIALAAGQRYYDPPQDMPLERIARVTVKSGVWQGMSRGIGIDELNQYDSDADVRAEPAQRWDVRSINGSAQIEVWPIPASDGQVLRLNGVRALSPFIADNDVCDLDGDILVLFAAADVLAGLKSADAQLKLAQAQARYKTQRGLYSRGRSLDLSMRTRRSWPCRISS